MDIRRFSLHGHFRLADLRITRKHLIAPVNHENRSLAQASRSRRVMEVCAAALRPCSRDF